MPAKSSPRRDATPSRDPAPALRLATARGGYGAGRVASSDVFLSAAPEQRVAFDHAVLSLQRLVQRLEDKGAPPRLDPGSSGGREQAAAGIAGGSGQAIPFRARMEQSFGADFGDVRAHFGEPARAACAALGAEAYTLGSDVAFRSASPSESLVAHELTHVVQQRGGAGGVATKGRDVGSAEAEAESVASAVASGRPALSALGGAGASRSAAPSCARLSEAPPEAEAADAGSAVLAHHTVAGGETLGSIAAAYYGAPREYRAIVIANHVVDPNVVEVGTPLVIPVLGREGEVAAMEPATAPEAEAAEPVSASVEAAPDPLAAVLEDAGALATGVMDAAWDAVEDLGAAAADLGAFLFGDETGTEVIDPAVVEELVVVEESEEASEQAEEGAPATDVGPVSETPAQADGPIDPANHQSRDTFVRSTVPEIAETTALIDALYRHFPKDAVVIGGYLDDNQQFWKVNFHWEWMLRYIDQALGLSPTDAEVATLQSIRDTLLGNPPDPATGYAADQTMTLQDASTSETVIARWTMMKAEKARLDAVWDSSGIPERSSDPKSFYLAAAPVAKPGTSKHGTGKALDIAGDNGRIAEIAGGLGATLVFDEASHVHVEFLDGVKA